MVAKAMTEYTQPQAMNDNVFRTADYEIRDIPLRDAREFIAQHHYSQGCSNTRVYSHGLFRKDSLDLLGVAMWLPPTKVAAESVNREDWRRVLSLTRLAIHPIVPKNGATFLMAGSIRIIRNERRFSSLVTYADAFMNHSGAIYRASNWEYIGFMKGDPRWEDSEGRQVARKATKSRTKAEMESLGYRMVGVFGKHKFVMHLADRRKMRACRGNDNQRAA